MSMENLLLVYMMSSLRKNEMLMWGLKFVGGGGGPGSLSSVDRLMED